MKELVEKIKQWATDRNLIKGCEPIDQTMKLLSEFGELSDAVGKNSIKHIKDGIGDVFVVLTILSAQIDAKIDCNIQKIAWEYGVKCLVLETCKDIQEFADFASNSKKMFNEHALDSVLGRLSFLAEQYDLTLEQCIEHAYNEIKDRKGIMHNGMFIKEDDERYKELTGA